MNLPIEHFRVEYLDIELHKSGNLNMQRYHYHDSYEIYLLEVGERSYMLVDQLVNLQPRDVFLIKPDIPHYTFNGTYTCSTVTFSYRYLHKYFTDDAIKSLLSCFEKSVIRVRERDFPFLVSLTEKLHDDESDIFLFMQILLILKQNMHRKNYTPEASNSKVEDILNYITENYKTINNLDIVANRFYISKRHLCDLFKAHTNTSVFKYINILKVHSAFEFLLETDMSMSEIAEKSGFSSLTNFSKIFKSYTGVSPLKYRTDGTLNNNKGFKNTLTIN